MPDADDDVELRELRARAYGRHGGLTQAEAERLHTLENARRPRVPGGETTPAAAAAPTGAHRAHAERGVAAGPAVTVDEDAEHAVPSRAPAERAEPAEYGESADALMPSRPGGSSREGDQEEAAQRSASGTPGRRGIRRLSTVIAVAAMLVLLGIGAGWLMFAQRTSGIALSDKEMLRRTELSQHDYDVDSVRAVARDDDALVWFATKDHAGSWCLILDVGETTSAECAPLTTVEQLMLSVSVTVPADGGDDGSGQNVIAYALKATTGDPLVAIQRWDFDDSMLDQFEGADRDRAEALIDEGFFPGLSIVGEFRRAPVWIAERAGETGAVERCLLVDAVDGTACAVRGEDEAEDIAATVMTEGEAWTLTVRYTFWQSPYLTIEQVTDAGTVVVDTETGDPIVITPPTDPDG
ncbi:hypothetical protein [Microbacterium sp. XT11]|uniref:hypothetical protein n=1 Tax=Microbacterium sp. XT11 TaxID=367477 RepID=UPI00082EA005|nr:hypothetical protein [Microbacterium sp. XT11]